MISPAAAESLLSTSAAAAPPAAPRKSSSAADGVRDALAVADTVLGIASKAGGLIGLPTAPVASSGAGRSKPSAGYAKSSSGSKTSSSKTSSSKKSSSASGTLAFLKDPKLSIEEKLMRLLSYLNERWEKDMQQKMDEIAGGQTSKKAPTSGTSKSTKSKKKGLLGSVGEIADLAKKFFPQVGIAVEALKSPAVRAIVGKIGGPVLAAAASALGVPALAPALLKFGPAVIDVAAGVASAFVDQASAAASSPNAGGSGGGATASAGSDGAMSDRQMQLKLMEIQRVMDQQKEMFSLVSNILRSGHDARMAVIQNVR